MYRHPQLVSQISLIRLRNTTPSKILQPQSRLSLRFLLNCIKRQRLGLWCLPKYSASKLDLVGSNVPSEDEQMATLLTAVVEDCYRKFRENSTKSSPGHLLVSRLPISAEWSEILWFIKMGEWEVRELQKETTTKQTKTTTTTSGFRVVGEICLE